MSPVRVTCARTRARLRGLLPTALAVGAFLAVTSALFAFRLESAEGGLLPASAVWATCLAPFLPALAAFLGMGVWSDERLSGRLELLLSSPVRERDLVFGKFLGVFFVLAQTLILSLGSVLVALRVFAAPALAGGFAGFALAFAALLLQGSLWCAVAVAASAFSRSAATAASATLVLLVAVPRGVWAALLAWAPQGRAIFGEMPLDAHVLDFSTGIIPMAAFAYPVLSAVALFVAAKAIALLRLGGRGVRSARASTVFTAALALVLGALVAALAFRVDGRLDLAVGSSATGFSARTRDILAEAQGEVTATCFLSRRDTRFRPAARLLRQLQCEAAETGSLRVELRFVDPHWDFGAAKRLVGLGAKEASFVFEKGRRTVVQSLADGIDERLCASSIRRLTTPPQRQKIYWTTGHGESSFDAYDAWGMSDIARELARDGYRNAAIDLSGGRPIPSDCALIVVAGAKDDFSRAESGRIDAYLRTGGRLLVLASSAGSGGVISLLPGWGLRPTAAPTAGMKTLSGSDVIVEDFSEHVLSRPLAGSRIVLERPIAFLPSAAVEAGAGADRIEFSPLARAGGAAVAAAVERGVGAGADLSIRPMRLVAIGDALFALNGQLAARANANRDFFLNCVAYLAGTDALAASGVGRGVLTTGLERSSRLRFAVALAGVFPLVVFLAFGFVILRRRCRR